MKSYFLLFSIKIYFDSESSEKPLSEIWKLFDLVGVMRATNLHILFKRSSFQPENIEQYICGLLSKFELALDFDKKHLLIPSLLPREQDMSTCIKSNEDVKVPVLLFFLVLCLYRDFPRIFIDKMIRVVFLYTTNNYILHGRNKKKAYITIETRGP